MLAVAQRIQRDEGRPDDEVVAALKRDILFGRLKPRERLVENELAERFGVGRHVIRAAFDHLDRAGLVQRRANRGVVVYDYQKNEVEQLYEMREILQRAAAERIPLPASEELIDALTAINAAYEMHLDRGELVQVADVNDVFHQRLFEACGNRFLTSSIEQYWLKTAAIHCYAIGVPDLARQSLSEHRAMVDALRSGDRERLVRLCLDHMRPALEACKAAHGGW
jgi:DNA-binding GntR family transcriptional regulator